MSRKLYYITALLLLCACPSRAQVQNDFGIWASAQVNKVWDKPYAFVRAEHRSCENVSATEAWFVAAGGGYNFTKWLKADLSYEFWQVPLSANPTYHKAVLAVTGTLRSGSLAFMLREKYEFAVCGESGGISNTLRSRLRAQYTAGICTPYLMYEFFNGFEGQGWVRSLHYAGTEINLGKGHGLDIFYMYHMFSDPSGIGSRHLLGLGYNFVF